HLLNTQPRAPRSPPFPYTTLFRSKRGKGKPEAASVTEGEGQNAPSEATDAPETDEDPVLVQISQADSKAALRRVWARNKARWSEVHDEAAKVRGKELE